MAVYYSVRTETLRTIHVNLSLYSNRITGYGILQQQILPKKIVDYTQLPRSFVKDVSNKHILV
jgi:hypothetical protein